MTPPLSSHFEPDSPYRRLARSLDALPNRFPPAADESDLRLLARLFTPEEAALAAGMQPEFETVAQIASRVGSDMRAITPLLKEMSKRGLIAIGKNDEGRLAFRLIPFVVGFFENQNGRMDAELAQLVEDYFRHAFTSTLNIEPQFHRVIPVGVSIKNTMEVRPFESASALIDQMQSVGVTDCICRQQKALVGEPCGHPLDVCMVLSDRPDAFKDEPVIRALTRAEAMHTLQRAAQAGLVHCVSNNQRDTWYICNCCTCSCGILRGMAELGMANVVARSAFVNRVDVDLCEGCGSCLSACSFDALTVDGVAHVDEIRCVGCGVCVIACPTGALGLERRLDAADPPLSQREWSAARTPSGL